jgi:radical SAM superfamily enzyme YgiQ (UPF0313 family)
MLTLININRMRPPIAPVGVDYVASAVRRQGYEVEVLDLCLVDDPEAAMADYFASRQPALVGISLRNVDDCFWPSGAWFIPQLTKTIGTLRRLCPAPILLGGVGFSIFPQEILAETQADYGIRGDGEQAVVALLRELSDGQHLERVPGLVWRSGDGFHVNPPAWPSPLTVPSARDFIDNATYFRLGGQIGVETKRGCHRACIYCADPVAKGAAARLRNPSEVADEFESLVAQGVDVFHLCDSEFNVPEDHARAVCDELIRRRLGDRIRWYTYMAVVPFGPELADRMRRAGCVGINFTSDAANAAMLRTYRQPHRQEDMAQAVRLCRQHGMAVMLDLLLGGPGETPETAAESIRFFKQIDPDCAGASLGIRLYPTIEVTRLIAAECPLETHPGIRRHYSGPIDLLRPTFYIAPTLGKTPARVIRELVAGDPRFFEPADDVPQQATGADPRADYNYNENRVLTDAIAQGARGAFWDVLRKLRSA